MVRRYIKEADLFKNNALNKILNKWKDIVHLVKLWKKY
jgi:hypothetical protein